MKTNLNSSRGWLVRSVIFVLASSLLSCALPSTGQKDDTAQGVTATAAAALETIEEALNKQPTAYRSAIDATPVATPLSLEATMQAAVAATITAMAATPLSTATATPDLAATKAYEMAVQTAVAATVAAVPPTAVELPTEAPTASPTESPTKAPTPTTDGAATATAEAKRLAIVVAATLTARPTATPPPTIPYADCQVAELFRSIWLGLQTRLGCNVGATETGYTITTEPFQNGFLIWFAATDQIYVLPYNAAWSVQPNTWRSGEASFACSDAAAIGYPAMGFGKVWCNEGSARNSLGDPIDKEAPDGNGQRQFFEYGQIFRAHGRIFVLFSDQTWTSY